ncbi:MAG: hypothetical protein AAB421_02280 [Patescibacteria group bacterium]
MGIVLPFPLRNARRSATRLRAVQPSSNRIETENLKGKYEVLAITRTGHESLLAVKVRQHTTVAHANANERQVMVLAGTTPLREGAKIWLTRVSFGESIVYLPE